MNYLIIALTLITTSLYADRNSTKTNPIQRTPTMSRAYVTSTPDYHTQKSQTQERKTLELDEDSSPSSWEQH